MKSCNFQCLNKLQSLKENIENYTFQSLELMVGIEPTACALRVRCSTAEPHQHDIMIGKTDLYLYKKFTPLYPALSSS